MDKNIEIYMKKPFPLDIFSLLTMRRSLNRISNLPDPILEFILSLVPLKSAIRTSILSKRWRNLWKHRLSSTAALDFGEELASSQSPIEFVTVVDRYLELYSNQRLESLRILFCPFDMFLPNIEKWITLAAMKEVQQLDLDLSQGYRDPRDGEFTDGRKPFKLPSSLFHCDSLTHLNLSRCEFCTPLDFKRFGSLRMLYLSHVNINDYMLQSILIECQILESLSMRNCRQLHSVDISGEDLRLEKFTMVDCQGVFFLQISAPKLQSLHLFGELNFQFRFIDISSLVDAFISSIGRLACGNYTWLLSALTHVKILTLCSSALSHVDVLETLDHHAFRTEAYDEFNPPDFTIQLPNLHELQILIDVMSEKNHSHIFRFFQICPTPFLERLFIRLPRYSEEPIDASSVPMTLKNSQDVIFNHLKEIKLSNFRGCRSEMRLVKFLLEKAIGLESLVIVAPPPELNEGIEKDQIDSASQSKTSERIDLRIMRGQLSMLPKASSSVSILVDDFWEDDKSLIPKHMEVYCEHSFSSIQKSFAPSFEEIFSA